MFNKFLEKSFLKFNSFQRKSMNTLSYALIRGKEYLSFIGNQKDISISLLPMETTTNTVKNQKFSRKVREESVEAI